MIACDISSKHYELNNTNLMFQEDSFVSNSAVAIKRSITGVLGPLGGQATRNDFSLLESSTLYTFVAMLGKSIQLS